MAEKMVKKGVASNILYYFLLLMIIILPLQFLGLFMMQEWFGFSEAVVFWAVHFYEPLFIIILVVGIIKKILRKDCKLSPLLWVTAILLVLGILSIILLSPSVSRGIEGFRFALFGVLAFFTVSLFDIEREKLNFLIKTYVVIAFLLSIWAIVERFLPLNYWQQIFGTESQFGYGVHKIVNFPQSVAVLGGPNQLAAYLLPAIFILLMKITRTISNFQFPPLRSASYEGQAISKQISRPKADHPLDENSKFQKTLLMLVVTSAIILTFSRSAFVALFVTLLVYFIFFAKSKYQKWIGVPAVILIPIILGLVLYFGTPQMKDIVTHGASQSLHIEAMKHSFLEIGSRVNQPTKLFFGSGLGTAGPATLKYGQGYVSESWYLQLSLELGIVGLLLWLVTICLILKELLKKNQSGLLLGFIALSITALFLHTWADNPTIAITIFILGGVIVQKDKIQGTSNKQCSRNKIQVTNKF